MEANVRDANAAPGEQAGDRGQVLEPGEDDVGACGAGHVGEEGDGGGEANSPVWNTAASWVSRTFEDGLGSGERTLWST